MKYLHILITVLVVSGIFIFSGLKIIIPNAKNTSYLSGQEDGFKEGYGKAKKEWYDIGRKEGVSVGYEKGSYDSRAVIRTAIIGAPVMLADKIIEKEVGYQEVVHRLKNTTDKALIKTTIKKFSDDYNHAIIKQIINFGGFTEEETDTILLEFERLQPSMSKEVYSNYIRSYNELKDKRDDVFAKAEALGQNISFPTCKALDLLTGVQKYKLALNLIQAGSSVTGEQIGDLATLELKDRIVGSVIERLCDIIVSESTRIASGLLEDYATVINFTETEVLGQSEIQRVMNLITAKNDLDFRFNKSFKRTNKIFGREVDLSVDPNYAIRVQSNVTAGIDLEKFYKVAFYPKEITESGLTEIVVTMPEPEIISVHTNIYPTSLNTVVSKNLSDIEIRNLVNLANQKAKSYAHNKGILDEARKGAQNAMQQIYSPLFINNLGGYRVRVEFARSLEGEQKDFELKG